ncbi:HAD-like domain-containing protein [Stachybotrys elegans]|uniref:HAD-like domain-containing protein n=1 Tax=Stachybotrys elegans TaxID=80388 RepID=A0A8K0SW57_9HYPO|nr:HAD-like domain-containing protein [Stachybotrys elegans]
MSVEPRKPKVLLFDIGGVCVQSPFQAILDYELSLGIPPGWVNYSLSKTSPNGYWHKLERGEIALDQDFIKGFNHDLHDPDRWRAFYSRERSKNPGLPAQTPPVPSIDGDWLFHEMMYHSSFPDPWMYPALQKLKASGHYILAALSNTVIFPPGHRFHTEGSFGNPVKSIFDVFVSSAHVGIRKPDPRMYQYALREVDSFAKSHAHEARATGKGWDAGVKPQDILFLDDIGENLKEARNQGFRTLKVNLGRAYEAVEELERVTGLQLEGGHPKNPIKPQLGGSKAKM